MADLTQSFAETQQILDTVATADITVNFDNTMTTAEMQALIDAVPIYLQSFIAYFNFADGAYSLTDSLFFRGFVGNIIINGNLSEDYEAIHENQAVQLSSTKGCIELQGCADFDIRNIEVSQADVADRRGIHPCNSRGNIYGCNMKGQAQTAVNSGIETCEGGSVSIRYTNFENGYFGVLTGDRGHSSVQFCAYSGTEAIVGIRTLNGGVSTSTSNISLSSPHTEQGAGEYRGV